VEVSIESLYMENCIFCKIVKKEIPSYQVWEDGKFFAFLDLNPVNDGHVLIIPKEHQEYVFGLEEPLYTEIFQAAKKMSVPLQEASSAKRIGLVVEGFGVDHLHLHLVPINEAGQMDSHNARKASPEELQETADKIKSYL
jgi:histidine triad (HIT) family protein